MTGCIDLVLDNGELVCIEYKDKHEDELLDSVENAMKRRDWWSHVERILRAVEEGRMPAKNINSEVL